MLEHDMHYSRHKLVKMPNPAPGIFKSAGEIASDFHIKSTEIILVEAGAIEVGPLLNSATLAIINDQIVQEPDFASMHELRSEYLKEALPRIRITNENRVEFIIRSRVLGGIDLERGFWVAKRQESDRGIVKEVVNKTTSDGYDVRVLNIYQKHFTDIEEAEGDIYLLTTRFQAVNDKNDFHERIKSWRENGAHKEELLGIVSVEMSIVLRQSWKSDEEGGNGASLESPKTDDGGSGVRV